MADRRTKPVDRDAYRQEGTVVVAATWQDPRSGALYVHEDLIERRPPYDDEQHISPMNETIKLGDVESWCAYVTLYGKTETSLLTWNASGLRAVLDYADAANELPGRSHWLAWMPFVVSSQWSAWSALASGRAIAQREAIERLEDLQSDIVDPAPADLMLLLRSLRSAVNAKAEATLREDGTTKIAFERDSHVQSGAGRSVDIPSTFQIAIPVLKGHVDDQGRPVVYRIDVRLRASVGDDARLALRFSMPTAQRILEDVYAERVEVARSMLHSSHPLLRAAD